ncbi:MAG: hypothetical protein PHQ26_10580, partial [Bacteroidales bacterium]|nr:hypothetical protein [Bacteroidales bacterium]
MHTKQSLCLYLTLAILWFFSTPTVAQTYVSTLGTQPVDHEQFLLVKGKMRWTRNDYAVEDRASAPKPYTLSLLSSNKPENGDAIKWIKQIQFGLQASTVRIQLAYSNDVSDDGLEQGSFDFYFNDDDHPFAVVPVGKTGSHSTPKTASIVVELPEGTGLNSVYVVWNNQRSIPHSIRLESTSSDLVLVDFFDPKRSDHDLKLMALDFDVANRHKDIYTSPRDMELAPCVFGWTADGRWVSTGALDFTNTASYVRVAIDAQSKSTSSSQGFELYIDKHPDSVGATAALFVPGPINVASPTSFATTSVVLPQSLAQALVGVHTLYVKWIGHSSDLRSIIFYRPAPTNNTRLNAAIKEAADQLAILREDSHLFYYSQTAVEALAEGIETAKTFLIGKEQEQVDAQVQLLQEAIQEAFLSRVFYSNQESLYVSAYYYNGVASGNATFETSNFNYGSIYVNAVLDVGKIDYDHKQFAELSLSCTSSRAVGIAAGTFEIYVDGYDADAVKIGTVPVQGTGGWSGDLYQEFKATDFVKPEGIRHTYIKFVGPDSR